VLLLGGSSAERARIARLVHLLGPQRNGEFREIDCRSGNAGAFLSMDQMASGSGTVFFDFIECLAAPDQHRLMDWLDYQVDLRLNLRLQWRVVAGLSPAHGDRLLPALFDSLDKWRIEFSGVPGELLKQEA